jgi:hypothetical protein
VVEQVLPTQQAPGHGLGVQIVPTPRKVLPVGHAAAQVTEQLVVALSQHAPAEQGLGVQVMPIPGKKDVPQPAAAVRVVQAQVAALQQTPQGLGEQVVPATEVEPAAHPEMVTVVQAPVVLLQQTRGHGFGLHVTSGQWAR